jgi:hypothetical protein
MCSYSNSDTELDDEDISYVEGSFLDCESAASVTRDLFTQDRTTSTLVDADLVAQAIAVIESVPFEKMKVKSLSWSSEHLTYAALQSKDNAFQDPIHHAAALLLDFLQGIANARCTHHTVLARICMCSCSQRLVIPTVPQCARVFSLDCSNTAMFAI